MQIYYNITHKLSCNYIIVLNNRRLFHSFNWRINILKIIKVTINIVIEFVNIFIFNYTFRNIKIS